MTNNDILRRLRYCFDFSDAQMIGVFLLAKLDVTRAQVSDWLKKDSDETFVALLDEELLAFLDGLILEKRGPREGGQPEVQEPLSNNVILRKLKIALNLQADDVLAILALADCVISKHELSAFFRKPIHRQYRECKAQILRNFLQGLQIKLRGETAEPDGAAAIV